MENNIKNEIALWSVYPNAALDGRMGIQTFQRPNQKFEGTFREADWPIWVIGQFFGVLPVIGVSSKSISKVQFKWKCKRTIYSNFLAICLIVNICKQIYNAFYSDDPYRVFTRFAFFAFQTSSFLAFIPLAVKWPKVMRCWLNYVNKLPPFNSSKQKKRFILKIRGVSIVLLILQLVEHSLEVVADMYFYSVCKGKNPIFEHVKLSYTSYTDEYPISAFEAVFTKLNIIIANFVWTYQDVFVATIGMALTSQFKLFNEQLKRTKGEHASPEYWIYQRDLYLYMCDLVRTVDDAIAAVILISFTDDVYCICKQLFVSMKPRPTKLSLAYFWVSVIFLIFRTIVVCFSVSSINDESKKPIYILRTIPAQSWNIHTERFFADVTAVQDTALTGMRFFYINRKLILSVLGTIVTFEFILLQFNLDQKGTPC